MSGTWRRRVRDEPSATAPLAELTEIEERLAGEQATADLVDWTIAAAARDAETQWVARLRSSLNLEVSVWVLGCPDPWNGELSSILADCLLTDHPHGRTLIRLSAVTYVRGLATAGTALPEGSIDDRLAMTSVLRSWAQRRAVVGIGFLDGSIRRGSLVGVGADFMEVMAEGGRLVVPTANTATITAAQVG